MCFYNQYHWDKTNNRGNARTSTLSKIPCAKLCKKLVQQQKTNLYKLKVSRLSTCLENKGSRIKGAHPLPAPHQLRHCLQDSTTHLIQPFKNELLSRNLDHIPKISYFGEKAVKSPQRRGIRPRTPVNLRWLGAPPPDSPIVTFAYYYSFRRGRF